MPKRVRKILDCLPTIEEALQDAELVHSSFQIELSSQQRDTDQDVLMVNKKAGVAFSPMGKGEKEDAFILFVMVEGERHDLMVEPELAQWMVDDLVSLLTGLWGPTNQELGRRYDPEEGRLKPI